MKAANGEKGWDAWEYQNARFASQLWSGSETANQWHRVKTDILYDMAKRRDVRAMEELFVYEPERAAALKKEMDDAETDALKWAAKQKDKAAAKEDKPASDDGATVVLTGKPNTQQRVKLANGLWVTRDVEFGTLVDNKVAAFSAEEPLVPALLAPKITPLVPSASDHEKRQQELDYAVDELWRAASIFTPLERELQQIAQSYRQVKGDRDEAAKLYLDKLKRITACLEKDIIQPDPDAALPSSAGQSPKSK